MASAAFLIRDCAGLTIRKGIVQSRPPNAPAVEADRSVSGAPQRRAISSGQRCHSTALRSPCRVFLSGKMSGAVHPTRKRSRTAGHRTFCATLQCRCAPARRPV